MDAYLALVSKRDTRRYAERAIPEAVVRRVLEAGRLAGSSRIRQPWRFVIVADAALRERLAAATMAWPPAPTGCRTRPRPASCWVWARGERVVIVLSFGFPHRARDAAGRTPEARAARADPRPLEQLAERL